MKRTSRTTLNKAVEILVNKLHFKQEQIMVTGSLALELHGVLPLDRETHDCDFLLTCDDQTWRCMRLVEAVYSDGGKKKYDDRNMLSFTVDDIKFNIWKKKSFIHPDIKDKTGIWVDSVKDILGWKRQMGRKKDWKDISEICRTVIG